MKQVLSFLLSLVLIVGISTTAFAAENTYHDVPTSHWAYLAKKAIHILWYNGLNQTGITVCPSQIR